MFLTETWLKRDIDSCDILPFGDYTVIGRAGRKATQHGGVLIAMRKSCNFRYSTKVYSNFSASIEIHTASFAHCFCLIYNVPSQSSYRLTIEDLSVCLQSCYKWFKKNCDSNHILADSRYFTVLGDINLPDVCWKSGAAISCYSIDFLSIVEDLHFIQLLDEPSHVDGNLLDVILSSNTETSVSITEKPYSDHFGVFFSFPLDFIPCNYARTSVFSQNLFRPDLFNLHLHEVYQLACLPQHADVSYQIYESILTALRGSCNLKSKNRSGLPYYYSSHTIHLLNKFKTLKRKESNSNASISRLQAAYEESVELDKVILFDRVSCNSTNDCFSFLRSLRSSSGYPGCLAWGKRQASSAISKAALFNEYFVSVYSATINSYDCIAQPNAQIQLNQLKITVSNVSEVLSKTSNGSIACDSIPPSLLSACANILAR